MTKIKCERIILILIVLYASWIFFSCINCEECVDNLSSIYTNCRYRDKDVAIFVNDEGVERKDTVELTYRMVPGEYCYGPLGKELYPSGECVGLLRVKIKDFEMEYRTNLGVEGRLKFSMSFYNISLEQPYYKVDTVDYNYNGSTIRAKHYVIVDASNITNNVYCKECIISLGNNILYFFSTDNQGKIENWKLKYFLLLFDET